MFVCVHVYLLMCDDSLFYIFSALLQMLPKPSKIYVCCKRKEENQKV